MYTLGGIAMTDLGGLDFQNAVKRMGGQEELYYKMLENFIKEYKDYPSRLKELIKEESDDAYVLTHSLKNISSAIGATALAEAAEQIETFLKDQSFQGNELYLQRLLQEHDSVMMLLSGWENPMKEHPFREIDPVEFIKNCRKALEHYSPGEVKKCRTQLEENQWPQVMEQYKSELISSLKGYRYQEAASILDSLEEVI